MFPQYQTEGKRKLDLPTNLILRQNVDGIGGAFGKMSVRWGSLKRASQSSWNLIFQSGSLKSTEAAEAVLLLLLCSPKTPTFLATLVGGSERRRELEWEIGNPRERVDGRWGRVVVITCEMEPIKEKSVLCEEWRIWDLWESDGSWKCRNRRRKQS